jgi:hypothetical protein
MRIASGLVKEYRVLSVSIFLIVAALVIGGAACDGGGAGTYQLAISSASGGSVTTPGAGTFTYDAGMAVQLVATPNEGYEFRSWTGDIASIGDPNAASTTMTMNGDYAIVANFETESETGSDEEPVVPPSS